MKRTLLCCLSLLFLVAHLPNPAAANIPNRAGLDSDRPEHSGDLLVKFRAEAIPSLEVAQANKAAASDVGIASLDALARSSRVQSIRSMPVAPANAELDARFGLSRWRVLELPEGADVSAIAERYAADPFVEFAEPDYLHYTQAVPNDTRYNLQWGHNNTAQMLDFCWGCGGHPSGTAVGTVGFDADAETAWDSSQGYGDANVVIAIIDSGVDTSHPDLRMWNNPGEVVNGIDDDGNGLIDDVNGWDFADNDSNPNDTTPNLPNGYGPGHGTACAGVAAARANNALGVAGVAGGCSVMALKTIRDATTTGGLTTSAIQASIYYAADEGASIISMSFGGGSFNQATLDAINYANAADCVLLAATGNSNSSVISYPSRYAGVIAVGAASPCGDRKRSSSNAGEVNSGVNTDPNSYTCDGERWWGSSYGSTTQDSEAAVDIIAPTILPTTDIQGASGYDPGNYSNWFNGTSCATPYAAGVAALLRSAYPTWTNAQVRAQLRSTATDVVNVESGAGWDRYSGYGMVNAGAALAQPDLFPQLEANWFDRVVPREDNLATFGSVPAPVVLTGDATSYFNGAYRIGGSGPAMVNNIWWTRVDGINTVGFSDPPRPVGSGGFYNNVARTVTGGRHTVAIQVDQPGSILETNESNNDYARQYVWTPAVLAPNSLVTRGTPPDAFADQSIVAASGNPIEPNSDGIGFPRNVGAGFWRAAASHSSDVASNFDVYLMNPTADVFTGFDLASFTGVQSISGAGQLDFVLVNDNNVAASHDVMLANQFGGSGSNWVETPYAPYLGSTGSPINHTVNLADHQMLSMLEVLSTDVGTTFRVSVEVTGNTQPVTLSVYDPTFTVGDASDALASAVTDASGNAFLDITPTVGNDYHGITVHRDPVDGTAPLQFTLRVRQGVTVNVTSPALANASVYFAPDGSGTPFSSAFTWTGTPGDPAGIIDATLDVNVVDAVTGNPVGGIPASDIVLTGFGFVPCPDGANADGPTDGLGNTSFSQAVAAGGGDINFVVVNHVPSATVNYNLSAGVFSNSSDYNGDLIVDLADLGDFSIDYLGTYNYRSDFQWDGVVDLADIGRFAPAFISTASCAGVPAKAVAAKPDTPSADRMALTFDAAGTERVTSLEPGRTVTAYVTLSGPAARQGIVGWEASLETSENVRVLDWVVTGDGLDLGQGNDHMVGMGKVTRADDGQPLVLAQVQVQVTDGSPAQLYLRSASRNSGGFDSPAIALAGEQTSVLPVSIEGSDLQGPAAEINGDGAPTGRENFVFEGVKLRNFPNPFNPATEIHFDMPRNGTADVRIYDVAGRLVKVIDGGTLSAGSHAMRWNGTDSRGAEVVSGTYHYRLYVDGSPAGNGGRMLLLK